MVKQHGAVLGFSLAAIQVTQTFQGESAGDGWTVAVCGMFNVVQSFQVSYLPDKQTYSTSAL
jgi:hypothetical protein